MERHQVGLYLAAILAGAAAGWLAPDSAGDLGRAVAPVLGLLLYVGLSPDVALAFANPAAAMRDPVLRFFFVEHLAGMLIAVTPNSAS